MRRTIQLIGPSGTRAFTLIEILIVVVILGILAAIVVPQFSNAAGMARAAGMREELRSLRSQIMVYSAQHRGVAPGYPGGDPTAAPSLDDFVAQMTLYTNAIGQTSPTAAGAFRLGPYLYKMPVNAINNSSEILFVGADVPFPTAPNGAAGWVYQPSTGSIAANVAGADESGKAYFDY